MLDRLAALVDEERRRREQMRRFLADASHELRTPAHRQWGLFLVAAHEGGRDHLHVGCWAIQCSHEPPRMLVSVDRRLPAVPLIRASGRFALSLLAADQLELAVTVLRGATEPAALPTARLRRLDGGEAVLADAVAHFICQVEGEFNAGADFAGFYGPVRAFAWGRRDAQQLRDDQLAAALAGGSEQV